MHNASELLPVTTRRSSTGDIEVLEKDAWVSLEAGRLQMESLAFQVRLRDTDFSAEVYHFRFPSPVGTQFLNHFFTLPWVMEFVYGTYDGGRVNKTHDNWLTSIRAAGLDDNHMRVSRHSKLLTSHKRKQSASVKDKVSGEYEYCISIAGFISLYGLTNIYRKMKLQSAVVDVLVNDSISLVF